MLLWLTYSSFSILVGFSSIIIVIYFPTFTSVEETKITHRHTDYHHQPSPKYRQLEQSFGSRLVNLQRFEFVKIFCLSIYLCVRETNRGQRRGCMCRKRRRKHGDVIAWLRCFHFFKIGKITSVSFLRKLFYAIERKIFSKRKYFPML